MTDPHGSWRLYEDGFKLLVHINYQFEDAAGVEFKLHPSRMYRDQSHVHEESGLTSSWVGHDDKLAEIVLYHVKSYQKVPGDRTYRKIDEL